MMQQQQVLQEKLSISQILRIYGKQFVQIRKRYSDGRYGRCAIGVIMSYFGWDGSGNFETVNSLLAATDTLKQAGIDEDLLIDLNDSGYSFNEIADYINRTHESTNSK